MIKVIVVAWFTFILGAMSFAPISLTISWIKGLMVSNELFQAKNIFIAVLVISFSLTFTYFMTFGVAIQFWIPIFPWMEKFAIPLKM
tara:strand:- start:402 stop:662 length:261 start_codon:yes stop_codon:yes gene_type:complete